MTVKLPHELVEKTIETMFPGESGWTVPWAMVIDDERNCYLRGGYTIHQRPGGTVQMEIHRNAKGFEARLPPNEKWHIGLPPDAGNLLPIVRLV